MNRYLIVTMMAAVAILSACGKENGDDDNQAFDRREMLINYADNLIIPAFGDLSSATTVLETRVNAFVSDRNLTNLQAAQDAWKLAYTAFQFANAYNFGPAGEEGLRKSMIEEIGTFPVSETKINANIASSNTNFNDFNRDNRGLLAIEYLLFSLDGDNNAVLQRYQDVPFTANYLQAVVQHSKEYVAGVETAWKGTYRNTFVNNTGTSVGSSTSQLYNEFVKNFEAIKNFKVGLPLGKRPGQIDPEPTRVEAYYSGLSIDFMKVNFKAVEDIWYGRTPEGSQGIGFRAYLLSVTGGPELVAATEAQLIVVKNAMNTLPAQRLSEQVMTNAAQVETLYNELQRHTRFFKSDMSSLLGIAITFSSGDGD